MTENRAMLGAKRKGREARDAGRPITANPYPDWRTYHGAVTFSRAFQRYWAEGWKERDAELVEQ